ncbi:MAG: DNA repair protein RadC [Polyangiaceae bacterium]
MVAQNTPDYGPRERAAEGGIETLGGPELIALLLGTGSPREPVLVLAEALLHEYGGMLGLARAGLGELALREGVGMAKGARLAAAIELGKRVQTELARPNGLALSDSSAVVKWARPRVAALEHEELWALAVDARHHLKCARKVASGGLHGIHVAARDPLRIMLREGASAFILVHNHPSGDPAPSPEDITFTERIAEAGDVVGTPLLDHVIIGRPNHTSMLDCGFLRALPTRKRAPQPNKPSWEGRTRE